MRKRKPPLCVVERRKTAKFQKLESEVIAIIDKAKQQRISKGEAMFLRFLHNLKLCHKARIGYRCSGRDNYKECGEENI